MAGPTIYDVVREALEDQFGQLVAMPLSERTWVGITDTVVQAVMSRSVDVARQGNVLTFTGEMVSRLKDSPQMRPVIPSSGNRGGNDVWVRLEDVILVVSALHRERHPELYPVSQT